MPGLWLFIDALGRKNIICKHDILQIWFKHARECVTLYSTQGLTSIFKNTVCTNIYLFPQSLNGKALLCSGAGFAQNKWILLLSDLQIVTGLLAVGDPLDLCGGGEVQRLTQVREAKRSRYPHVCQRQIVHVQQRP